MHQTHVFAKSDQIISWWLMMCTYVDLQDVEGKQEDTVLPNSHEGRDQISLPALNLPLHIPQNEGVETVPRNITERGNNGENKELTSGLSSHKETSEGDVRCSMCKGTGALMSSHILPLEGASKQLEANRLVEWLCVCYLSEKKWGWMIRFFFFFSQRFKPLFPVRYTKPSEIKCIEGKRHIIAYFHFQALELQYLAICSDCLYFLTWFPQLTHLFALCKSLPQYIHISSQHLISRLCVVWYLSLLAFFYSVNPCECFFNVFLVFGFCLFMQSAQVSAWPFLYQTDLCVWVCVYLPPVSYTWIFNEKDFDIFSKCIVCDVFLNVFYV